MELVCTHKGNDVFSMQSPTPILSDLEFDYERFLLFFNTVFFNRFLAVILTATFK